MAVLTGSRMVHASSAIRTVSTRANLLGNVLKGAAIVGGGLNRSLNITDVSAFKSCLPTLTANVADFGDLSAHEDVQSLSAWIIGEAAQQLGAKLNSPQDIYVAIAEGKITRKMSFPAVNVRGNSLDTARALFKAAIDNNVGALIIEIARSEMGYTNQSPREFAAVIQAAAILEGFKGPLFLQGDHIQLKAKPVNAGGADAEKEITAHRALIENLMRYGFGSVDLDMSPFELRTQAELSFDQQQAQNALLTAQKIADVRALEAKLGLPWTTLLGGETGEVGKMNTRAEDLDAYARGIIANMQQLGIDPKLGIRKIAINDGTSHGGIPGPDGKPIDVAIAFEVLDMATRVGRQFGWAGSVQHGASTLPNELFGLFPQHSAVEVHLATGFQNQLYDHGIYQITGLEQQVEADLLASFPGERKDGQTVAQFVYSTRKKWLGPNKHAIWTMPDEVRAAVAVQLYDQFSFLFGQLGVVDTRALVDEYTTDVDFHLPFPAEGQAQAALATDDKGGDLAD